MTTKLHFSHLNIGQKKSLYILFGINVFTYRIGNKHRARVIVIHYEVFPFWQLLSRGLDESGFKNVHIKNPGHRKAFDKISWTFLPSSHMILQGHKCQSVMWWDRKNNYTYVVGLPFFEDLLESSSYCSPWCNEHCFLIPTPQMLLFCITSIWLYLPTENL